MNIEHIIIAQREGRSVGRFGRHPLGLVPILPTDAEFARDTIGLDASTPPR